MVHQSVCAKLDIPWLLLHRDIRKLHLNPDPGDWKKRMKTSCTFCKLLVIQDVTLENPILRYKTLCSKLLCTTSNHQLSKGRIYNWELPCHWC
jgi:hypothetical protein